MNSEIGIDANTLPILSRKQTTMRTHIIAQGSLQGRKSKREGGTCMDKESESIRCAAVSSSLQPHGLQLARLLCPWDPPGKNTGAGLPFPCPGDL